MERRREGESEEESIGGAIKSERERERGGGGQ